MQAGKIAVLVSLLVLFLAAASAEVVQREVSGTFPQDANGDPFPLKAGELNLDVKGDLPPTRESLTIRAVGIIDETLNIPPEGDKVVWWDDDSSTYTSVPSGVGCGEDFYRTVKHPDFKDYRFDSLSLEAIAWEDGTHIHDDDGDDDWYHRLGKFYWAKVVTENNGNFTKNLDLQSSYDGSRDYGWESWDDYAENRETVNFDFPTGVKIKSIRYKGYAEMCDSSGSSGAGIVDITPVKSGGFFKNVEKLEGQYGSNDDWVAADIGRGTYHYRVEVASGPVKFRKDEAAYCRTGSYMLDKQGSAEDDTSIADWPAFCLKDWTQGSEYDFTDGSCSDDYGGCNFDSSYYWADTILEEDKGGSSEPHSGLNENGDDHAQTLFDYNSGGTKEFRGVVELFEEYVKSDSQNYQDWYNVSYSQTATKPDQFSPWPAFIDESLIVESGSGTEVNYFKVLRIWPTGNTWLRLDGEFFGGKSNTVTQNNEVEKQLSGPDGWVDAKTIDLNFRDHERVEITGEYFQGLPNTLALENYRLVHQSTGYQLFNYTGLEQSGSGYVTKKNLINLNNRDPPSGTYVMQMKANDGAYNVRLKQRQLKAEFDEDIRWNKTADFAMNLSVGENNLEFFTERSNVLEYEVTWTECRDPLVNPQPADDSYVQDLSMKISMEVKCERGLDVTFYNADSDGVIGKERDLGMNSVAESDQLKLTRNKEYRWYAKVCDTEQDACHTTPTFSFTAGEKPDNSFKAPSADKSIEDAGGRPVGLDVVLREEDFNGTGNETTNYFWSTSSTGYVNQVEENSNQLEPGMETATYGMETGSTSTVGIWNDSDGTSDSADQWAITPTREWVVSNTGKPFPPWNAYYRNPGNERTSTNSPTISKTSKVFGNSLAVVAQRDVTGGGTLVAKKGAGVWIDPDMISSSSSFRNDYVPSSRNWYELLDFDADLTGPDSGIGYDAGDGAKFQTIAPGSDYGGEFDDPARGTIKADILFQGEGS
ncbi:MAG: hypothetical protein ABEJ64_02435 [Candidatus Nanohaloarchaea archaeon]